MSKIIENIHILLILWIAYSVFLKNEVIDTNLIKQKSKQASLQSKIKKKEKQVKQVKNYYADIERAKENIQSVTKDVEKLQRKLPLKVSDAENMDILIKVAKNLNIKNIYVTPKNEKQSEFYFVKDYELKATGTYLQFVIFLEKIAKNERLFNIQVIALESENEAIRGQFKVINAKIIVQSFRYNPDFKVKSNIDKIDKINKKKSRKNNKKNSKNNRKTKT
jgi:Tfp pilus assembly protein PilO